MNDAPEKIWAMASIDAKWSDAHATKYKPCVNDITAPFIFEYTRSDVAQERIAKLEARIADLETLNGWYADQVGIRFEMSSAAVEAKP